MLIQRYNNVLFFRDEQLQLRIDVERIVIAAAAGRNAAPPKALEHFHRPSARPVAQRQLILGGVRVQVYALQIGKRFGQRQKRHPKLVHVQLAEQAVALLLGHPVPQRRYGRPFAGVAGLHAVRVGGHRVLQAHQLHRIAHRVLHLVQRAQPIADADGDAVRQLFRLRLELRPIALDRYAGDDARGIEYGAQDDWPYGVGAGFHGDRFDDAAGQVGQAVGSGTVF